MGILYSTVYGNTVQYMGIVYSIWEYCTVYGNTVQYLGIAKNVCQNWRKRELFWGGGSPPVNKKTIGIIFSHQKSSLLLLLQSVE